jgi:hypothetical protein
MHGIVFYVLFSTNCTTSYLDCKAPRSLGTFTGPIELRPIVYQAQAQGILLVDDNIIREK